jgi:hypothetical protein
MQEFIIAENFIESEQYRKWERNNWSFNYVILQRYRVNLSNIIGSAWALIRKLVNAKLLTDLANLRSFGSPMALMLFLYGF